MVLAIAGEGIKITPVTSSDMFFDMKGDGYQHRTAWAGAGNGVLVLDLSGVGNVDQQKAFDFMAWDPSATSDMQALRDVFDTNHDGKLDAGDALWSEFKVLVTNADGTTQLETMDQLGITSINLTPDNNLSVLPDGSRILGETTFSKSDGTTGIAADVAFASDPIGYATQQTVTRNPDGSTTIDVKARNPDGSLAKETVLTTSSDGLRRTMSFDNTGDGIFDHVQTDNTVVNADGSHTETLSDLNGAGRLLDRTATTTSQDGKTVAIRRDLDGNGVVDQSEVRTTNADGSRSDVILDLNPNGSVRNTTAVTTSVDGLARTVQIDINGDGVFDLTETDAIVVSAAGARAETIANFAGNALVYTSVTTTSPDARVKSTQVDLNGDGIIDLTQVSTIVVNADKSTTTTQQEFKGDGLLRDQTVTTLSADGLSKTTQADLDGNGTFDVTTIDDFVKNADGSLTETVTQRNADGSLRDQTTTIRGADGISRTVDADANGDGHVDVRETIAAASSGATVDTVSHLAADGALESQTISTQSADGLTLTVQSDFNGDGAIDETSTRHKAFNPADGSSTTVSTDRNADGSLRDQTSVMVSANGLSTTTEWDTTGSGTVNETKTDVTVLSPDGSRTETVRVTNQNGSLRSQTVATTSADRNTMTVNRDVNGDGHVDQTQSTVVNTDGSTVATATDLNADGSRKDQTVIKTSVDGLSTTTQTDTTGSGIFDQTKTDVTVLNQDGSRTETVSQLNTNGSLHDRAITTVSADGLTRSTQVDNTGTGLFDHTQIDVATLNLDASRTETVFYDAGSSSVGRTVSTTSADGLSITTQRDTTGDGAVDQTQTDVTVLNANGSRTETVQDRSANGTLTFSSVMTTNADGVTASGTRDVNGDGIVDQSASTVVNADGSTSTTVIDYNPDGSVKDRAVTTVAANRLSSTIQRDNTGAGTFDQIDTTVTVINADGSRTETVTCVKNGAPAYRIVTTTSANGLSTTKQWDATGAGTFNLTETDVITLNADGSQAETLAFAGARSDRTTTTTSADRNTVTVQRDLNGDGIIDQSSVTVKNADGSVTSTVSDLNADGTLKDQTITTTSANGLSSSIKRDTNGDSTLDQQRQDVTILNPDGSQTETIKDFNAAGGLVDERIVVSSGNGLSTTTQWDLTGAGAFSSRTNVTTLNADGSQTDTITDFNSTGTVKDRHVETVSANGLSKTTQWDTTGRGNFNETATDVTLLNADGSRTETITASSGGRLMSQSVVTTSASGLLVTRQSDTTGSGRFDQTETTVTSQNVNGSSTRTVTDFDAVGAETDRAVTTMSADGLTVSISRDANGDGVVDQTDTTVTAVDGSNAETITDFSANGVETDQTIITTSANGLLKTTQWDYHGNGTIDRTRTDVIVRNADGSRTETLTDVNSDGTPHSLSVQTTSADGRTRSLQTDSAGNGKIDHTEVTTINIDGSSTTVAKDFTASGTLADMATSTVSADQHTKTVHVQTPSGAVVHSEVTQTNIDGSVTTVATDFNLKGTVLDHSVATFSADGLLKTVDTDSRNAGFFDKVETVQTRIDGSKVTTDKKLNAGGSVTSETVTILSADGQTTITETPPAGIALARADESTIGDADVVQGAANGTVVGTASGIDVGPAGTFSYSLANAAGGRFAIDASTGTVTVANGLLLFPGTTEQITVRAIDQNGISVEQSFNVAIVPPVPPPVASFQAFYDGRGNLLSQTGIYTSGTSWSNVYDPTGANGFTAYTNSYDAAGKLTSHTQANVDGTHTLTAYDTTNTHGWATFTITFDSSFNITSITGTNHGGGTTINQGEVLADLDTLTWYANPFVYEAPTLTVQNASGNAGTAIALSIASTTTNPSSPPTVTVAGVPSAATLSAGTRNADGTWTLNGAQLANLTMLVPAGDFAGSANLTVTSSEADAGVQHAFTTATLAVTIAGVASAPALSLGVGSGVLTAPIPLAIASALTGTDGAETLSTVITGVPRAASLSAGTKNADGSWSLAQKDLSGLTLTVPAGSFSGSAALTVTATATETDGSQAATSAELMIGDAGNDTLAGGNENAVFIGGAGNDTIVGGTGVNTAVYTGNFGDYAISYNAGTKTFTVSDQRVGRPDGVDTVSGVTMFQFADATVQYNASAQLVSTTIYDRKDVAAWSSFETSYDATGNVASQTGFFDGGSSWVNVFDPTGAHGFTSYTNYYDALGNLVSHTQTNHDGTHTLTAYDTTNTQRWATFTIAFDVDFNQLSVTGVNHDGTTNVDVPAIESYLDTLTWFASPFVVQPTTATGGDLPVLSVQNAAGNAGSPIALSIASSLTAADAGDTLSINITGVPRGALLSAGSENADGSWTLAPAQLSGLTLTAPAGTFAGTANFTVVATATGPNGLQVSTSANMAVAIAGVATAPTLVVHNVSGNAGSAIALGIASLLTASDGTETLAIKINGVPGIASLSAGTKNADGSWSLTSAQLSGLSLMVPPGTFSGTASLAVTATATETDGSQALASANFSVAVAATAAPPSLSVSAASGAAGSVIGLSIASALTATDGTETLSIKVAGVPAAASLSAGTKNPDGSWSLTPAQLTNLSLTTPAGSFAGTANLTVTATATETNGSRASTSANLAVAIAGVATAPTLSATGASGNAGHAIPLSIASALTATDGTETLSIKVTGVPSAGSLSAGTKNADGSWSLTAAQLTNLSLTVPAGSFAGAANLSAVATATETDGSQASSAPVNFALTIAGVATPPSLSVQNTSGAVGTPISLSIASALTATDGTETLSIKVTGLPNGASLSAGTRNADGSWSLTPAQLTSLSLTDPAGGFVGTANLTVVATATETDGSSAPSSANMAVTIVAPPTLTASAGPPVTGDLSFKSLSFTGANHQTVTQVDAQPSDSTKLTIALWFKLSATGQLMGLVSTTNSSVNDESFYIDASGHLVFNHRVNNQNVTFTSSQAVTDTNWHQVVFSGDATQPVGKQMQMSLDGVRDTAVTQSGSASFTSFLLNSATGYNPAIGVSSQTQGSAYFSGEIADFYFIDGEPQMPASSFVIGSGAGTTYAGAYTGGFDAAGSWLTFANATSATTLGYDDAGGLPGAHAGVNNWTLNNGPLSSSDGPKTATVIPWNVNAILADPSSETLSLKVTGMPSAATLSAGTKNADGSWSLTPAQLAGLTVTVPGGSSVATLTMTAIATATTTGGAQASTFAQLMIGGSGNDSLAAGGGIVALVGGSGNDTITGGPGQDTAVYAGNFSDYAISYNAGTQAFTVSDQRAGAPDGTDTVSGVRMLQFANSTAQYDASGNLRTLTFYDTKNVAAWASFQTNYDALGNVVSQVGINVGGSSWTNVYDPANQFSWSYYTNYYDGHGALVSHTQTNDDGTHSLTAYDTTSSYSWATFTMTFDANWNETSVAGVNHDGTTTLDMGQVWSAFDTLTWYSSPYVVTPPSGSGGGSGGGDGLPVLLGLDGNGIDVVPLGASSTQFDMTGSGTPVPTAWAGAGDGILAIDLGAGNSANAGAGIIDQAKQIEFTQWAPGTTSDMAALEQVFDTNHNSMLDPGDALWNDFRVCVGSDGVGTAQVFTLAQLGITSISLTPSGPAEQLADGSVIQGLSTYTMANGTTGVAGDVALAFGSGSSQNNAPPIMLSNGSSADAAVAQLISAMAATTSAGNTGFSAAPVMSTSHDANPAPVIAAALHP